MNTHNHEACNMNGDLYTCCELYKVNILLNVFPENAGIPYNR